MSQYVSIKVPNIFLEKTHSQEAELSVTGAIVRAKLGLYIFFFCEGLEVICEKIHMPVQKGQLIKKHQKY